LKKHLDLLKEEPGGFSFLNFIFVSKAAALRAATIKRLCVPASLR
jgi:hypothetical protein